LDRSLAKIRVVPAAVRMALDLGNQGVEPRWRVARGIQRAASFARAVPGCERLANRGEELNVLGPGLAGGANRPAEDSGGANGSEEHAFVMRIARLVGADHLVALGQTRLEHDANLRMNAARRLPKNRRQIRAISSRDRSWRDARASIRNRRRGPGFRSAPLTGGASGISRFAKIQCFFAGSGA